MISAVIITKNEEAHIARCIRSLLPLTDDIIIIDSGSTDNTAGICKQFPVTFEVKAWQGFSTAKNYGNSLAKYNYILSIDGDEELSADMQQAIGELMKNPTHQAYDLPFLTNFCGKWIRHGAWYPESHIRLFDKNLVKWEGDIHEKLIITSNATTGKIKKGYIHHYTISNLKEYIEKINHYTSLHAEDMHKRGKKASFVKLYIAPYFSFFRDYIIKLGILDGYHGYTIAKQSANYVFLKYMKLKMMEGQRTELITDN
ncbi:MAG: glycosyltransferase family 2 protein [Cytophagaceae bacterium]|jgi:glycosyltransferase involved in cell wall biosynthesis|nr:glycosyltransferase family 2 protein [Cytophagaceae bacterium]